MTTRRSRLAKAAAVALVFPVLGACSIGFGAPTDQVYIQARGVSDRDGTVDVLNAVVVSAAPGAGTVSATLVNNVVDEDDELTGVTVGGVDATISSQGGEIAANGLNNLGASGAVTASSPDIEAGKFVEVVFSFQHAESVTLSVPVVPNTDDFADVPVRQAR